eukprot:RCo035583
MPLILPSSSSFVTFILRGANGREGARHITLTIRTDSVAGVEGSPWLLVWGGVLTSDQQLVLSAHLRGFLAVLPRQCRAFFFALALPTKRALAVSGFHVSFFFKK